ncbi:NRDE-2, necessary for RNA interference-domain-containing protein [Stachybotrys elegans]|uniref:NRDE-2, necessary for RNA interference-domain-containing protein n=1 Tax=Stachybotrys elegans TaxID=80388 RepID=A0A8K0WWW9_9HYPO|nr:NRDE-2, necessary for RNA interference-domain-containing protein [Stachybotrys elegans]
MPSGEDSSQRLTVPKFSSFKPKESAPSTIDTVQRPRERDRDGRHGSRQPDRHRSRSHRHDSHSRDKPRDSQTRDEVKGVKPAKSGPVEATGVPGVFVIDTKGDPLITKYGGIDKSQIPTYYRYGGGRVLGTKGRLVMHRDGPRDQFSLRMPGQGVFVNGDRDGLRSKSFRLKPHTIELRAGSKQNPEDDEGDFISVETSRKRKRDQEDPVSSEDEGPSYRSIEGKAKATHHDQDVESDASSEIVAIDENDPLRWRSIQLNRRVKDHPEDIDAWLELANHQDALLQASHGLDEKDRESATHSYTEIKVSMLESALVNVTTTDDRQRVLIQLMREGVKVWSSKVAAKKWIEVHDDEQRSFALWKTHVDFTISNIATFQYDEAKAMLLSRLGTLTSQAKESPQLVFFEEAIQVFLRTTRLMYDAGYQELATAAWQALLDLNLFRPAEMESGDWLDEFRDYWESEVPRMGEADAKGWNHYVSTGKLGDPPEPVAGSSTEPNPSRDAYKVWGNAERHYGLQAKLPARTLDEGTDDDPFRVVMFTDIEPMLFLMPSSLLPDLNTQLIDAFVLFAGYHPPFRSSQWTRKARNDQYLVNPSRGMDLTPSWTVAESDPEDVEKKTPKVDWELLHAATSPEVLFKQPGWFGLFAPKSEPRGVDLGFFANVMKQLTHGPQPELSKYYMAVSFLHDPSGIKKVAKGLLVRRSNDSELYNCYALAERANGNADAAIKVLSSATRLSKGADVSSLSLWKTWSWLELERGNIELAAKLLCSSVDEGLRGPTADAGISPTSAATAHGKFASLMYEALGTGNAVAAGACAECLILLVYLTAQGNTEPHAATQGNISEAMAVTATAIDTMTGLKYRDNDALETLLQFAARLLYLNALKGPYRRAYLREQLKRFIDLFPQNTIFMALFDWADASLRVVDETRALMVEKTLNSSQDSVGNRLFAIHHELQRGNVNTTRAAFEHAVSSEACRGNAWLWVGYIRFCQNHDAIRDKAKSVFYRALRHVPYSKETMMEAFATLARGMESDELRSVYNTMTSKGLRIHVDMEEFLEKQREERHKAKHRAR